MGKKLPIESIAASSEEAHVRSLLKPHSMIPLLLLNGCASLQATLPAWVPGSDAYRMSQASATEAERYEQSQQAIAAALRSRDITLGMTRDQVREAWGEPRNREYSGESASGNERWSYSLGVSSFWSVQPKRVVYFDRGVVSGWETTH